MQRKSCLITGLVDFGMGLMDFAIGPVNSLLNLPEGQMKIFWRIKIIEQLQAIRNKFMQNESRFDEVKSRA